MNTKYVKVILLAIFNFIYCKAIPRRKSQAKDPIDSADSKNFNLVTGCRLLQNKQARLPTIKN